MNDCLDAPKRRGTGTSRWAVKQTVPWVCVGVFRALTWSQLFVSSLSLACIGMQTLVHSSHLLIQKWLEVLLTCGLKWFTCPTLQTGWRSLRRTTGQQEGVENSSSHCCTLPQAFVKQMKILTPQLHFILVFFQVMLFFHVIILNSRDDHRMFLDTSYFCDTLYRVETQSPSSVSKCSLSFCSHQHLSTCCTCALTSIHWQYLRGSKISKASANVFFHYWITDSIGECESSSFVAKYISNSWTDDVLLASAPGIVFAPSLQPCHLV